MFNFFKKKIFVPEFKFIKSYPHKDKYFSRTKKWDWLSSEQINLIEKDDEGKVRMTTMDFWSQEMFLDANGQITIEEYLNVLIKQFQDSRMKIPKDLDEFMTDTLWSLKTDLGAIEFTDSPIEVKSEYKNPITEK